MLLDFRKFLTSKPFVIIIAISAILRLFFYLIFLPSLPSNFGPDEGTYATLAKYVSLRLPVQEFPAYGPGLYNSARTLILPSSLLISLGFNELDAVRLISTIYGLLSSFFLTLIVIKLGRLKGNSEIDGNNQIDKQVIFLVALFTFFPSNFVWSTIGLRESASQFWLIASLYFLLNLVKCNRIGTLKYGSLSVVALTLAHGARPETALIFALIAFLSSVSYWIRSRRYSPILVISLGIICGQTFTNVPIVKNEIVLAAFPERQTIIEPKSNFVLPDSRPTKIPNLEISSRCKYSNQELKYKRVKYICGPYTTYSVERNNPIKNLEKKALLAKALEYKRNVNSLDAQSALPTSSCQLTSTKVEVIFVCNLKELPFRLMSFLFRPFLFLDQGSTVMKYAALENIVWLLLIPFSIFRAIKIGRNTFEKKLGIFLIIYVFAFSIAAALYEGNLGTAFRHKSTILWPIILILIISQLSHLTTTRLKLAKK